MDFCLVRPRTRWCGAVGLLVLAGALPSCAFFSSKPPLPKQASLEHVAQPPSATDYAALIAEADVVYFPGDRTASGGRSEPAALLLEAFEQSGKPMAIGWDLIDASQQPLLDELQSKPGGEREELIARLELIGSGRAREHCRAVLREAPAGMRQIALRCPAALIGKLASGEKPSPEEEKELPRGYRASEGGLDAYAEHFSSKPGVPGNLAESYGAQLLSHQFAAEKIVRHFRAVGGESKLLVFLGRASLEEGRGVPAYVAQKLSLRQVVLGRETSRRSGVKLLARRRETPRDCFQVVDRAPVAARD